MRFVATLVCFLLVPAIASATAGRLWVGSLDTGVWETSSAALPYNGGVDPQQVDQFLQAARTLGDDGLVIHFVFYQVPNGGNFGGMGNMQGHNPVVSIPNTSALIAHLRHGTLIQMDIVDSETGGTALSVVIDDLAGQTEGSLAMFDIVAAVTNLSAELLVKDSCPDLIQIGDPASDKMAAECEPIEVFEEGLDRPVQLTVEVVDDSGIVAGGPAVVIYLDLF